MRDTYLKPQRPPYLSLTRLKVNAGVSTLLVPDVYSLGVYGSAVDRDAVPPVPLHRPRCILLISHSSKLTYSAPSGRQILPIGAHPRLRCLFPGTIPAFKDMLPHAQSYLHRLLVLDEGLPDPAVDLEPLPEEWGTLNYYDTAPDSWHSGDKNITTTAFRDAQASASSRRLLIADSSIDLRCPLFYFEVFIEASDLCFRQGYHTDIRIMIGMAIDRYPWERDIFGREECSTTAHLREPSYYFVQSTLYPFSTAEKCTDSRSVTIGDTPGCGISRKDGHIFWTKNGACLGSSCYAEELRCGKLQPFLCIVGSGHSLLGVPATFIPSYLRTITNFGQQEFAFRADKLHSLCQKQRRLRFDRTAKLLPPEILMSIADISSRQFASAPLSRIAMVCRTWAQICRPAIFDRVEMTHGKSIRNFQDILRFTGDKTSSLMKDLHLGLAVGESPESVIGEEIPSLPLFLATSGRWLGWLEQLHWEHPPPSDRSRGSVSIQHAPPRIEIALAALLHPMRTLTTLELYSMEFKSFAQVLRVLRAIPLIKSIRLSGVTVRHAPHRVLWPKSIILTALGDLDIADCSMPLHTIPSLVSIGLRGTPNPDASLAFGQRDSVTYYDGFLCPDHEDSLLRAVQAVANYYAALPDRPFGEQFSCGVRRHGLDEKNHFTLVIPPLHFHLRLYWPAAKQKPEILEIDAAEIRLLRDSRRNSRFFEQLAPLLRTLDAPISEIATHDNPPSSFRCDLRVAPDEVSQVRKTLSGVMPILSERQLITVVAGDEWGMLEEETDEDLDNDMSDEKPVRRRRRSRSRGSKDLKKLWMKKRLEETVDEETE